MTVFKNHKSGFSFIEIIVTVLMFGTLVTALLLSMNTSYRSVMIYSHKFERVNLLANRLFDIFYDKEQGKDKPQKKITIENPPTTITYETRNPKEDSALKKFKHIQIEKVVSTWKFQESEQAEQLVSFMLKPDEEAP